MAKDAKSKPGAAEAEGEDKQHTARDVHTLNGLLKFLFFVVNSLYCLVGAALIGLSIYCLTDVWADLDPEIYRNAATIMICTGVMILLIVMCGCFGAVYQEQRTGTCKGRRLLSFYQLCLLILIGLQFYSTVYMLNVTESLVAVKDELSSAAKNETVAYVDIEESLSKKFNDYYFDTVTDSQSGMYWAFVDDNCPSSSGMGSDDCNDVTYASTCPDEDKCYADDDGPNDNCPYDMCRSAAVTRFLGIVTPIGEYGIFVCIFETALMILTCCLICFNPRDGEQTILMKSGNFAVDTKSV